MGTCKCWQAAAAAAADSELHGIATKDHTWLQRQARSFSTSIALADSEADSDYYSINCSTNSMPGAAAGLWHSRRLCRPRPSCIVPPMPVGHCDSLQLRLGGLVRHPYVEPTQVPSTKCRGIQRPRALT
jgi:hypothetical protein